eukprot:scaffold126913_cov41-Tisochrysis_lutea.AAC.4
MYGLFRSQPRISVQGASSLPHAFLFLGLSTPAPDEVRPTEEAAGEEGPSAATSVWKRRRKEEEDVAASDAPAPGFLIEDPPATQLEEPVPVRRTRLTIEHEGLATECRIRESTL